MQRQIKNNKNNGQNEFEKEEDDDDFIILQRMSPQQQKQMLQQRKQQLQQFYTTNKQYQISSWYKQLQPFTFKSYQTQLTAIDAYILYWMYYNDHNLQKIINKQQQLYQYYLKLINKINTFLNTQCKQFNKNGRIQCFMKLATRSPKDLGYKYSSHQIQQVSNLLTSHLNTKFSHYSQQNKQLSKQFINSIYRFFLDLSKEKFKIENASDFVQIFSSSQRIIIDISDFSFIKGQIFSQFQKKNFLRAEQPFIQLWARQWNNFKWFEELRCFFNNYELTAACQYDQRCYFQQIQGKDQLIQNQVLKYFDLLKPALKQLNLSKGVMDLVLFGIQGKQQIKIKLIEINVFNRNSRASLFSWDRDLQILNGPVKQKIEIRFLTQPKQICRNELTRLMGMMQKGTDKIIEKAMNNLGLINLWNKFE